MIQYSTKESLFSMCLKSINSIDNTLKGISFIRDIILYAENSLVAQT
jgi:hypothetical protein